MLQYFTLLVAIFAVNGRERNTFKSKSNTRIQLFLHLFANNNIILKLSVRFQFYDL